MHRTEGLYNSSNLFVNGPPGTRVEKNILNAFQEEIANVIEGAGLTLQTAATDTRDQLASALAVAYSRYYLVVDPTVADQGVATTEGDRSIKDHLDAIGTSKYATLLCEHNRAANNTDYICSTTIDASAYTNVTLKPQPGARLVDDASNADFNWGGKIDALPNQQIYLWGNGTGSILGTPLVDVFYGDWLGLAADDASDDGPLISMGVDMASNAKVKFKLSAGTYFIADPGISIAIDDAYIEGTDQTVLRCERTYYSDEGGGQFLLGQGTVIQGDTITNITLKNIQIKGVYDTAWGDQTTNSNDVAGSAFYMLYFQDCTNLTLDNVKITNSRSSSFALPAGHEARLTGREGYNAILISGCTNVKLLKSRYYDSCGEGLKLYDCTKVFVDKGIFDNSYGISFLDIIYSTYVKVVNSNFLKTLKSDSGDLLNVASSHVIVSGNTFLNGGCDVGNETLSSEINAAFLLHDTVVIGNTLVNGAITMATTIWAGAGAPTGWVQENVEVAHNTITIDLDTRPAANGTTVLDYTAVKLPVNYDARNISVHDNTIILKGTLQAGGATYNRIRLINGIMGASGYARDNIAIKNNKIKVDLTGYDTGEIDKINTQSGWFISNFGGWTKLSIKDNEIDCPVGITMMRHDSIAKLTIKDNTVSSESFFLMPDLGTEFDVTDLDITDNKFTFYNTAGHTYTSANIVTQGFGSFVRMHIDDVATDIVRMYVRDNIINAATFVYISNSAISASVACDIKMEKNNMLFVDYGAESGTVYGLFVGKANTDNDRSTVRLIGNYFTENAATSKSFKIAEWDQLDIIDNEWIGTYTLDISTDDISGVGTSRLFIENNRSLGITDVTLTNANTAVTRLMRDNSADIDLNVAITNTQETSWNPSP